jgi:hypothetical protein
VEWLKVKALSSSPSTYRPKKKKKQTIKEKSRERGSKGKRKKSYS